MKKMRRDAEGEESYYDNELKLLRTFFSLPLCSGEFFQGGKARKRGRQDERNKMLCFRKFFKEEKKGKALENFFSKYGKKGKKWIKNNLEN